MNDLKLYILQRLSALIMIPLVFCHLGLMIYAVQDGLTATEILSRTKGSIIWAIFSNFNFALTWIFWAIFYSTFVLAVSTHASIGLRGIIFEIFGFHGIILNFIGWIIFLSLLSLGIYSVYAVTKL